jgi:hypothetical protein
MLKKSLKYLLIVFLNLLLLSILLAWWTDEIELTLNEWVRPFEFVKLIGISIILCIALRLLIIFFRKKNVQPVSKRLKIAGLITVLLSSHFYCQYAPKIIHNRFINGKIRDRVAMKIEPSGLNGFKAHDLTIEEYNVLAKAKHFHAIAKEATAIQFAFDYDGFLPDYIFELDYDVPLNMKIDTFSYHNGRIDKYQLLDFKGVKQTVHYEEVLH